MSPPVHLLAEVKDKTLTAKCGHTLVKKVSADPLPFDFTAWASRITCTACAADLLAVAETPDYRRPRQVDVVSPLLTEPASGPPPITDHLAWRRSQQEPESGAFCAGRQAVAHERTRMEQAPYGWLCTVCGERWETEPAAYARPYGE